MITFKVLGKKYPFPTRWEDVTYLQSYRLIRSKTLADHIHIFTDIPRETIETAEIHNLEKISLALSFLSFAPDFTKPTKMIGPYFVPDDITIQSTGQFEDLRALLAKIPKDLSTLESTEQLNDLYLHACAIYCQKLKDGKYDPNKVAPVKEELKSYACTEVIGTGAFFLFKPLTTSMPTTNLFQRVLQRLKRWRRD